ncbi:MAG: hypothetical protein ABI268_13475 [Rhodanobacter sp.]
MHWLDPDALPKTTGTLERFLLNPKADIDGLLLTDGTEIHTPPHLSLQLTNALKPGDALTVRGVKTRSAVVVAVAIDPDGGERIDDEGPAPKHHHPKQKHPEKPHGEPVTKSSVIQRLLHGPKGQVHGVLLDDGMVVRFASHHGDEFQHILAVDKPLSVSGVSLSNEHGTVIDAQAMGDAPDRLVKVIKHPDHGPKKLKKIPHEHH